MEFALAKIYSDIDCGNACGDLIGGKAVERRVQEMDRRGKTRGTEKYLTYPENVKYFLEDGDRKSTGKDELEKALGDDDSSKEVNTLSLVERAMDIPLVVVQSSDMEVNYMEKSKSTKRPPRKIQYDFMIERLPDKWISDEALDAAFVNPKNGKISEVAYRDLDLID